ncbi:MAG: Cysteine synthase [Alphaproteobacteria bacterium MarineAlpha6_Bin4]|nr:MAG: Cysteine synthase [Alphaproteobacteria bacterium MarineAlpha6_Bin3]PPR37048.1 MAG: Cysteine synthase [Alphaproteobacteria bacterium MarineAlpha6_Bin4]|tara:strand:+ start:5744 stop:6748 length:1005 start_codon:yes stop_codon:yes gene_type:complete
MNTKNNFTKLIGNTPLIKLEKVSKITKCNILGKAEFLNPGQSVKDRAALYIIKDAIKKNKLKKNGIIVEGTAGNTGIGLTLVGNSFGFKSYIVMPKTQSEEKKNELRSYGAELHLVPAVPYSNPKNYVRYSETLANKIKIKNKDRSVLWANQFDNLANFQAHYETTGPEIWRDTKGKIDGFICAVGTGGTIAGIGSFLKKKNKKIKIGLVDPMGSALHNFYTNGKLESSGSSITEGIGQSRITENLKKAKIDESFQANDRDALNIVFDLLKEEGLVMGGSTGINIMGAIQLAKKLGPGSTVVTILCDYGTRYFSKVYNKKFLKSKKLPIPDWLK